VAHLERAVALFPEYGAAHYALALSYRALGRRDAAERALEQHARYGPRWPAIPDPMLAGVAALRDDAETTFQRGIRLADEGDLSGAIAAHEEALARDPSIAQAHANLISLYGRSRNWAKADEHYRAVVALGFNLGDAHYDYGVLLGLQEKWDAAADAYRQAIAVNPRHAQAHNNLGQILERQRALEAAADEYRRAAESQPAFRIAGFNLGRMLIALGRNDEAIHALEPLIAPRDAEAPRYLFALATAHVRAGHRDEGIKWANDARQLAVQYGQQELAAAIERELAQLLQPELLSSSQQGDRFANAPRARFRLLGHVNPHDEVASVGGCQLPEECPRSGIRPQRSGDVDRELRDDWPRRVGIARWRGREAGRCEQARRLQLRPPFAIDRRPLARRLSRRDLERVSVVVETFDETVNPSEA